MRARGSSRRIPVEDPGQGRQRGVPAGWRYAAEAGAGGPRVGPVQRGGCAVAGQQGYRGVQGASRQGQGLHPEPFRGVGRRRQEVKGKKTCDQTSSNIFHQSLRVSGVAPIWLDYATSSRRPSHVPFTSPVARSSPGWSDPSSTSCRASRCTVTSSVGGFPP